MFSPDQGSLPLQTNEQKGTRHAPRKRIKLELSARGLQASQEPLSVRHLAGEKRRAYDPPRINQRDRWIDRLIN